MKFEPKQNSFIIALNRETKEEDLEIISSFYEGYPAELEGYWNGQNERSYQLDEHKVNMHIMVRILGVMSQESFIRLRNGNVALIQTPSPLGNPNDLRWAIIGRITQVKNRRDSCTYCPTTQTYWKALL